MSLSYTRDSSLAYWLAVQALGVRTGTFFCDSTTAQSFPRTPTDVMFAAVMALNAYSRHGVHRQPPSAAMHVLRIRRTDLVESALIAEDGDVSVEASAPCAAALAEARIDAARSRLARHACGIGRRRAKGVYSGDP